MFVFTVCQVGAEGALKSEIASHHPDLRFAYARPGFITFKSAATQALGADLELRAIFARAYGLSIGKATEPAEIFPHAEELQKKFSKKPKLHIFERDTAAPGDEPKDYNPGKIAKDTLELLRKDLRFQRNFHSEPSAQNGDLVLDLIYLDEGSWWIGYHQHTPHHSPFAGGRPEIQLPENAPSRAYLKLEEALLWAFPTYSPMSEGQFAVEIGSAPGGAVYSLLQRGLNVMGIDPGEMSEIVTQFGRSRFRHIAKPAAQVHETELPKAVHWILLDINLAPVLALNTVERIAPWFEDTLLGVILTLKLNDWKFAGEIPKLLRRIEKLGMVKLRARQLANNKQEICVVALTRKGSMKNRR